MERLARIKSWGIVAILLLAGCSGKQSMHPAKLRLDPHVSISFQGVTDGHCDIADVMVDAKDKNRYTVICRKP